MTKKFKLTLLITTIVIVLLIGWMKLGCTGLWQWRVSKVPHNLLNPNEEPDYRTCRYEGIKGFFIKY